MKMPNFHSRGRRAISPIVATVLIVAVTLVASVAIAGFVFGIFASQGNTAQVSVTATALKAADFLAAGQSTGFTCGAAAGSYLTLTNSGTAPASITSMTIVVAGVSNTFALTGGGGCSVNAVGAASNNPQSLLFVAVQAHTTVNAVAGNAFTGTVTTNTGAILIFAGTFQ